jgi:spermidine synthase
VTTAQPAAAPTTQRGLRPLVLFAGLGAAACGFVYELLLVTLGSHLIGNSVQQVSVVLAIFVAAMGLGSQLVKPLLTRPVVGLVAVEGAVALCGGASAFALYAAFAWFDLYSQMMIVAALVVGTLVGAELPLLIALLQRVRPEAAGRSASDLLAADYAGALIAGLGFPFLLIPFLGQLQTGLAVGALNAGCGLLIVWLFRRELRPVKQAGLAAAMAAVLACLGALALFADDFEVTARQALYDDPIVAAHDSPYQSIVLTNRLGGSDLRLFLNGDLQFSSLDEYRYHEALVHPAMAGVHERVLILGGGDGLALREVLQYPGVARAVEVELDPAVLRIARKDERLTRLNRSSLSDPRVQVVVGDAFAWLRTNASTFDVIIADFPDPDDAGLAKLYSMEIYALMTRALRPGGRIVVQAGSPYFAQKAFWAIERTLREAGLQTTPYHVDVPSFGDWGFHLAATDGPPLLRLAPPSPLRFLDASVLDAAGIFPADRGRIPVEPSTLNRPRIVGYAAEGWHDE